MTPERLQEIRNTWRIDQAAQHRAELLAYVDELTRKLEDARDIAVRCGAFETWTGTDVETYVSGARADER